MFERAQAVADAVLLEGYMLYPYRATSLKNRFRWTFGVLAPRAWSDGGGCEAWWMEAQCLLAPHAQARMRGRLRFFRARRRRLEEAVAGSFREVEALEVGGRLLLPWDEGEVQELDFERDPLALSERGEVLFFDLPAGRDVELVHDAEGRVAGRVVRETQRLRVRVHLASEPVPAERSLRRLRVRAENLTPWDDAEARREAVLGASCLASHLILHAAGGEFISLLDPPAWAGEAAAACSSTRAYPVLGGSHGQRDLLLAAPIILYDHPQVAPESPTDFCDATEIDELLALRTSTLTHEEKRQARATDPRAAALVDRVEHLPPELMERLHGAARAVEGAEMVPRDAAATGEERSEFSRGMRVVLRPGPRRTDAQDLLYAGRAATIEAVMRDVDGHVCLALTIDDDPATELFRAHGRYYYYYPDEVEPLAPGAEAT